jgi:hypothetical protein
MSIGMRQVDMYSGYVSSKNGGIILHLSAKHISFRLIIELDVMGLDKTSEHTIALHMKLHLHHAKVKLQNTHSKSATTKIRKN